MIKFIVIRNLLSLYKVFTAACNSKLARSFCFFEIKLTSKFLIFNNIIQNNEYEVLNN